MKKLSQWLAWVLRWLRPTPSQSNDTPSEIRDAIQPEPSPVAVEQPEEQPITTEDLSPKPKRRLLQTSLYDQPRASSEAKSRPEITKGTTQPTPKTPTQQNSAPPPPVSPKPKQTIYASPRRLTINTNSTPELILSTVFSIDTPTATSLLNEIHKRVGIYSSHTFNEYATFILQNHKEYQLTCHSTAQEIAHAFKEKREQKINAMTSKYRSVEEIHRDEGDWRSD